VIRKNENRSIRVVLKQITVCVSASAPLHSLTHVIKYDKHQNSATTNYQFSLQSSSPTASNSKAFNQQ
jgi:hypothetical protein